MRNSNVSGLITTEHGLWSVRYDTCSSRRSSRCSSGCTVGAWSLSWDCCHQLVASHDRCWWDLQWSPCHWIHHLCGQEKGNNLSFPELIYNFSVWFVLKITFSHQHDIFVILVSKVLEVSSPTAGSALLGPSQIQSLHAAQELTVRTMSAHGESCDSFPVNVSSKLATITAGPPVVPPIASSSIGSNKLPMPSSNGDATAKLSMLPCSLSSDINTCGLTVEPAVNHPHGLHSENLHSSASYVKAWADPSSSAILAVCEATLPVRINTPVVISNVLIYP